jgi:hypothetical protein
VHLFVDRRRVPLRVGGLEVVAVTAAEGRRDVAKTVPETTSPTAPTIMRMTPTVETRNP